MTDYSDVIDFENIENNTDENKELIERIELDQELVDKCPIFGNKNFKSYRIKGKEGNLI